MYPKEWRTCILWNSLGSLELTFSYSRVLLSREGNGTPLQYSCLENPMDGGAWRAAVHGVTKSRTWLSDFSFTFHLHALEKEMATHSSVLAWRIPGTGEPVGLPSMGSHRVGHDWSDLAYSIAQHSYHAHDNLGTLRRHATNLLCSPSKDMLHCIIQIYKWNEKDWLEPSGNRSREESERCRQPTAEWVLWGQCAYWGDPCMHLDNLMLTGKSPECFMYWLHSHEC